MENLLDQLRMQMYRRKKRKDTYQAAMNRNRKAEELKRKEKETIVVEKQDNVFENLIEKVIPTVEKPAVEKTTAKVSDDTLLAQIDEFRVRAQQLQLLLDRKQEKAKELQQIVSEREDKAEELEKIVKERQVRADGLTEAVEKKIDSMVYKVDAKLDEVKTTVNSKLQDGQEKEETRNAEIKEALDQVSEKVDGMSAVTEQLDTVKADLSEKIHIRQR